MEGRKADFSFTDSPYNVDNAGGIGAEKAGKDRRILNDARSAEQAAKKQVGVVGGCER
jgi:hypothetical protein